MEQHQVRLGDVLDDYCPRERRVTNHAVVAIVGDEIKLTRCTTCDNEHPYKEAKVPPRRQTKLVAALSKSESRMPKMAACPVTTSPAVMPSRQASVGAVLSTPAVQSRVTVPTNVSGPPLAVPVVGPAAEEQLMVLEAP